MQNYENFSNFKSSKSRLMGLFLGHKNSISNIGIVFLLIAIVLHSLAGLFLAIVQRLLKPIVLIRVGRIYNQRLGHFIMELDWYQATNLKSKRRLPFELNLFFLSGESSNVFLERIVKANLHLISRNFLIGVFAVNRIVRGGGKYLIAFPIRPTDFRYLDNSPPGYTFSDIEHLSARESLVEAGINPDEPIVCFFVRDSAYEDKFFQTMNQNSTRYRDCDVVNFEKSMEFLANHGYQVFRMGKYGVKPLSVGHPKIFDYTFSHIKNDFLDFYISSKCEFAVATDSGSMMLPIFFRKPLLLVNVPAFHGILNGKCLTLFQFKTFLDVKSGKEITLLDLIKRGVPEFETNDAFMNAGIVLQENSSNEVLNAVKEMMILIGDDNFKSNEYHLTQEVFNLRLKSIGFDDISGKLALSWLKQHPSFLK